VRPFTDDTLRISLHLVAVTVWVGGQLVLAGLVPGLREIAADAPARVARRFNRIAWPAYGIIVATGVWNLFAVRVADASTEYLVTLFVKLLVVAASGIGAFLHTRATSTAGLAVGGAVAGVGAVAALFLGVQLTR
jgi:putative copper export protein